MNRKLRDFSIATLLVGGLACTPVPVKTGTVRSWELNDHQYSMAMIVDGDDGSQYKITVNECNGHSPMTLDLELKTAKDPRKITFPYNTGFVGSNRGHFEGNSGYVCVDNIKLQ